MFDGIKQKQIKMGITQNLTEPYKFLTMQYEKQKYKYPPLKQDGAFKIFWNFVLLVAIGYTITIMPYKISFVDGDSTLSMYWEMFLDLVFLIDIFVSFASEYDDPVTTLPVSDYNLIAKNYIATWFVMDLIAWFPF